MTATTLHPHALPRQSARDDRRARRFARLWRLMDEGADRQIRAAKSALLTGLPREIVEIGPGCGANFRYLAPGTRVIAFEPNEHLHDDLRRAAGTCGIELDLRASALGPGQLADASQELVLSTLVLCSVEDVDATLHEVHRVLRPGGRLLFIEHVSAPPGTGQARYQKLVRRAWRALGDGCDPCARTAHALARSELVVEQARLQRLGSKLDPTNLIYWGFAVRPANRRRSGRA